MNENYHKIFDINPKYSTIISFILGMILIENLTADEQNTLGNWIMLVAQTIITNASSQYIINNKIKSLNQNLFIYDMNKIKEIISNTYPNNKEEINILLSYLKDIENKLNQIKKD